MTIKHFPNTRVMYKAFGGDRTRLYPEGARYFVLKLNAVEAEELKAEGFNVKEGHKGSRLTVQIDRDYDVDLAELDQRDFQTAEVFFEGRPYVDPRDNSDRRAAFLINITPKQ
jgi:hypothetical protein